MDIRSALRNLVYSFVMVLGMGVHLSPSTAVVRDSLADLSLEQLMTIEVRPQVEAPTYFADVHVVDGDLMGSESGPSVSVYEQPDSGQQSGESEVATLARFEDRRISDGEGRRRRELSSRISEERFEVPALFFERKRRQGALLPPVVGTREYYDDDIVPEPVPLG